MKKYQITLVKKEIYEVEADSRILEVERHYSKRGGIMHE